MVNLPKCYKGMESLTVHLKQAAIFTLKKRCKDHHQAGKSRTKAALSHPPIVLSTRAAVNVCHKKPSGLLAATLCPFTDTPLHPQTQHHWAACPLKHIHTSSTEHAQKTTKPQQSNSGNKLLFFCPVCLGLQGLSACICKWDAHGWAQNSSSSPGPSPHPCPACALLADSSFQSPTSHPGFLVLFQPVCSLWQPLLSAALWLHIIQFSEFHSSF